MTTVSRAGRASATETRLALVHAAERLVAEHGVSGFSTQLLHLKAGVRNVSALQYYFGSRAALIRSVWSYRMGVINPQRIELLESASPFDLNAVVEAIILPLAGQLVPRPEGNYYLRFLERLDRDQEDQFFGPHLETKGLLLALTALRQIIAARYPNSVEIRLRFASIQITSCLAGLETDIERGEVAVESLSAMVGALKRSVVAALLAPEAIA